MLPVGFEQSVRPCPPLWIRGGAPAFGHPPLGVGEADDAAPVGHALGRVHEHRALLVLQLRQLAQRLHRRHQAVQDAAALGVLAGVGRPHRRQRRHELRPQTGGSEKRNRKLEGPSLTRNHHFT